MAKAKETAYKAPAMSALPTGLPAITKALTSIKTRGVKLQNDVHIAACAVLRHVGEHKDVRVVQSLLDALPASYRTNAVRDWFTAYGPVVFEKNKPVYVKGKETELTKAMSDPFWLFSVEAAYVPVDVNALINSVIKKLTTDQEKAGTHHGKVIAVLEGLKGEAVKPAVAPTGDALVDALNN